MFYRTLPSGDVKPGDLLGIALHGSAADLARLVIAGIPGGLIKLLPALALGFVASHTMSGGSTGALYAVAATLAGFGLLGALLHLLQSTAMMRLEGRSASRVEAAFWDRLMRLPPGVLHRYPAGDLAMSGMTFQNLRDGLQGVVADSLLSVIFLLPGLRRHLLLRRHPRDDRTRFQPGFAAGKRSPRLAPDLALRADDQRGAARSRPTLPGRGRHRQAAGGERGRIGLRHLGAGLSRAEAGGARSGRDRGTFTGFRHRAPIPGPPECCSSR